MICTIGLLNSSMDSCIILLPIHHTQEYVLVMDSCYTSLKCSYFPSTVLIFTNKVCIEIKKKKKFLEYSTKKRYICTIIRGKKRIYISVWGAGGKKKKKEKETTFWHSLFRKYMRPSAKHFLGAGGGGWGG